MAGSNLVVATDSVSSAEPSSLQEPYAAALPIGAESAPPKAASKPAQPADQRVEAIQVAARRRPERPVPTVLHANAATFDEQVLRSQTPVLVDFYASWCGPCRRLAPVLEQVAAESPQAKVVKVNIEADPRLAERYGIRSLPSLLLFKEGRVVAREKGVVAKSRLKAMLAL